MSNKNSLLIACKNKNSKLALELIKNNEDNRQYDSYGNSALMWACLNKMDKVALQIIEKDDSNIGHYNKNGDTALMYACLINESCGEKKIQGNKSLMNECNKYNKKIILA